MNVTEHLWWEVNTGPGNGLVPSADITNTCWPLPDWRTGKHVKNPCFNHRPKVLLDQIFLALRFSIKGLPGIFFTGQSDHHNKGFLSLVLRWVYQSLTDRAAYHYRFFDIDTNTDTTFRYRYQFDPYRDIREPYYPERGYLHWKVENCHQEQHTQPTATACAVIMCSGNCQRACQGSVHISSFFILCE